jgi:hypothetical protein
MADRCVGRLLIVGRPSGAVAFVGARWPLLQSRVDGTARRARPTVRGLGGADAVDVSCEKKPPPAPPIDRTPRVADTRVNRAERE